MAAAKPARTPLCSWNEDAYLSAWSIMHFLSGYLWNVVWTFAFDGALTTLNFALFVVAACVFELVENQKGNMFWMWGWLGYKHSSYTGDTAINSISDVLVSMAGWGAVYAVVAFTRSMLALGLLLGAAGALFVAFLVLFRIERRSRVQEAPGEEEDGQFPALLMKPQQGGASTDP